MQYSFMTQAAQACMSMYNLDTFSDDDVAKDWKEGEDGGKSAFSIDDQKRNMVDLETIGQIADSRATFIRMSDHYDFVAAIYEFG